MNDQFQLQRFVQAQQSIYPQALAELKAGRKRSHWMWFVFPQLRGLGHSEMAQRYGISGADEARAYLAHPLLGPRLEACTQALLHHAGRSAREILGTPDDLKFRSCMTLFASVAGKPGLYRKALDTFFDGAPDRPTLDRLGHRGHDHQPLP